MFVFIGFVASSDIERICSCCDPRPINFIKLSVLWWYPQNAYDQSLYASPPCQKFAYDPNRHVCLPLPTLNHTRHLSSFYINKCRPTFVTCSLQLALVEPYFCDIQFSKLMDQSCRQPATHPAVKAVTAHARRDRHWSASPSGPGPLNIFIGVPSWRCCNFDSLQCVGSWVCSCLFDKWCFMRNVIISTSIIKIKCFRGPIKHRWRVRRF